MKSLSLFPFKTERNVSFRKLRTPPFSCYVGIILSDSSIGGHKEVTFEYKLCTYVFDTGILRPPSQSLFDMGDRDQQKSFAFYTGMFLDSPNLQKQSTLCCLAYVHLCYSILTQIQAVVYLQSTTMCLLEL